MAGIPCILSIGVISSEFFFVEFLGIDGAPGIDDVCKDERHEERYPEHRGEGKLT